MAILPLLTLPDNRLRQISKPVAKVGDEERLLMDNMLETMYAQNGIGLAAIQIGVAKRIITIDLAREGDLARENGLAHDGRGEVFYFVNPKITWQSQEMSSYQEGCLSVPEFFDDVARPSQCRVEFLDYHGKNKVLDCQGLLATCIQHEMDHLEGILFIDHLSRLKRQMVLKKASKALKVKARDLTNSEPQNLAL